MRPTRPKLLRALLSLPAASVLILGLACAFPSASLAQSTEEGRVVDVTVHGDSLAGNLGGVSADRDVLIYLPPSYDEATSRRYPVVYLLHGYSLTNEYWVGTAPGVGGIDVPAAMDRDIASGNGREMILVMPNAYTEYGGSMYSASVTIGDWESFIADDLVGYVDSHYRTVADRASRGLAGHSMGGYGTIRIGMKRPDVFSSLYILSACCLMNDPSAFSPPSDANDSAQADDSEDGASRNADQGSESGGGPFANVVKAEAAAWSPNPQNPPTYFDMLGDAGGASDALIAAKWAANSPLAMIDQYIPNLKRYTAIGMDVGRQDGLMASNEQLADVLAAYGIDHSFETYDGNHANRIAERMEQEVIPFFSEHLDFGEGQ